MNPADINPPITVLVVDDSVSVRKALERILAPQGYLIRMADSAESALDTLDPLPDLVLADILMPGMSGLELARILMDRQLNVPVMLMSGIVDEVTQRDAQAAGARGVLRKPFTPAELLPAIEPQVHAALDARAQRDGTAAPASTPAPVAAEPTPPAAPAPDAQTLGTPAPQSAAPHSGPLAGLQAVQGVEGAVLYSADGDLMDHFGPELPESFAMYARFMVTAAATASHHLNRGDLSGILLSYAGQTLLLSPHRDGQLVTQLRSGDAAGAVQRWQTAQLN
ncbi:response regulator [Deinococcus radiotolerans]|uniref:Transcriptional regulator n=1 Tax=Deinococcus radiotolerans TaxID=1309407 RepID=A0ABQ2FN36_9DEIO|nr:response regulator [Deinococcus radiotolerans]GGL10311.1 transcriptional regulator [Deinococcus radiotolerans]